ncbi:MAG: translocation/assembly module TamB, partial [Opitutaceae bacterium]|nr:translocation/assembly module TamB [Opitutaceae bacterium]
MPEANPQAPARRVWRRRLVAVALGTVVVLALAVATLDWWLPAGAGRLAGIQADARDTRWGRSVAWSGVEWSSGDVRFTADRLELEAPTRLLLKGGRADASASGWELVITEAAEPAAGATPADAAAFGWPELMDVLGATGMHLRRWAGNIALDGGVVRVAGEVIEVRSLKLRGSDLGAVIAWRGEEASVELDLVGGHVWLRMPRRDVELTLRLDGRSRVNGDFFWAGNAARGEAEFAVGEWLPDTLGINGADWRVPAELLGLGREYEALRGGFAIARESSGVAVKINAQAAPRAAGYPPVTLDAEGKAGPLGVRLQTLNIEAPWLKARLGSPLEWRQGTGWAVEQDATFDWAADLAAMTGGEIKGRASGDAVWSGGTDGEVVWRARLENAEWENFAGVEGSLEGRTTSAETRLVAVEARADGGERLSATGRYYHAERRIGEGVFRVEAAGATLEPWLPSGWRLDRAVLAGEVDGELSALSVRARIEVEHGTARAVAAGSWERGRSELKLTTVDFVRADGARLELVQPGGIAWTPGARVVDLAWRGDARMELLWREGADATLRMENVDTTWLDAWRSGPALPRVSVRRLALGGRVDGEGFLAGAGELEVDWADTGWLRAKGEAGREGLNLARLELGRGTQVMGEGAGVVPWRLRIAEGNEVVAVEKGEWSLRLVSRPEAELWRDLARRFGMELERPSLELQVAGPALAPEGRVALDVARAGLRGEGLPDGGLELSELQAKAEVSPSAIRVSRLSAKVDGQRLDAEGRLVLASGDWARLRERPFVWLRDHAEARFSLPEAPVAALSRYVPALLAPMGTMAAELRLSPGANLDGSLRLTNGATRPLGSFGVLQGIDVELALAGREVEIARMRATAGGQPFEITGKAMRRPGEMPALDLRVKASRFPLVRRPGLVLRADLDLAVKTAAERTRLSGEVRLVDSLFLADIRPMISGGGKGGGASSQAARPPYFSVDTPPLADWELALRVQGERFLRLRTPVFAGEASARFDLGGTLREPRAIGEAWVERGTILFPFANFTVQSGAVRLPASDPYTPLLEIRAAGRRLGYDLKLELGGTADSPQMQLFSSPPLETERLLLMITAGTSPNEGQGAASSSQRLAAVGAYMSRDLLRTFGVAGSDEERLTLSSGERVSRQGRETYGFEFKLNDKWSLAGEYDEFDA